jgi:hypothetical protein
MIDESPRRRGPLDIVVKVGRYMRSVAVLLLVICIIGAIVILMRWRPMQWSRIEKTTIEFLRREDLMFLVTDRVATRVDVASREGSIFLGWHESILVGTVRFLCGIDLKKLTPKDIRQDGGKLVITVPDPEVLDLAFDLDSLVLFAKKSGLVAIKEYLENQDTRGKLQKQLEARARQFAVEEELLPKREEMVKRLNDWVSPLLTSQVKVDVEFR